ncbi:MAG TPA: hypothetical protein VHT27_02370 [Solirubrobacteraceae bacterium]|nr:hypothetical protein [Solirubrobacteraceae bacterium]
MSSAPPPPEPDREESVVGPAAPQEPLIEYLEPDQLVRETLRRVPPARLSHRARAALWALRVFAVALAAMVIYAFVSSL